MNFSVNFNKFVPTFVSSAVTKSVEIASYPFVKIKAVVLAIFEKLSSVFFSKKTSVDTSPDISPLDVKLEASDFDNKDQTARAARKAAIAARKCPADILAKAKAGIERTAARKAPSQAERQAILSERKFVFA